MSRKSQILINESQRIFFLLKNFFFFYGNSKASSASSRILWHLVKKEKKSPQIKEGSMFSWIDRRSRDSFVVLTSLGEGGGRYFQSECV